MEILITHSYFLRFDPKELRAMMPYPPLGTLYAASVLRAATFSVAVHDSMFQESEDSVRAALQIHRPRVFVIYDDQFNYLTKMCLGRMREAAFRMARIAKEFGCTVIVFSSDASDHLEKYFLNKADFVILGEAEHTLQELCTSLLRTPSTSPEEIAGIAYFSEKTVRRTGQREIVQDLDQFPFPAWDLINLEEYRSRWKKKHGYWSMNLVSTRGCPFHCNWCAKPIYGQVYHSRSPGNVVSEMSTLATQYQPDQLWFADDIFGLKPGWLREFAKEVVAMKTTIPFKCLSRVDLLLKDDSIRNLKIAGCEIVWVGAESGSQKILDAMEKGTTLAQIREATETLRENGMRVGFFLQFGYPGETRTDIELTLQMLRKCSPDEIGVSISYPLPGTKFYDRVRIELGSKQNWNESGDLDMMFQGTFSRDYYRVLHRYVHKKFSIWRGIKASGELLRNPMGSTRRAFRSVASMVYNRITLPIASQRLNFLEQTRTAVDKQ
jgi:radical SAM superfamily enzyme YgiQ (UPF0313 family)